MKDFAQLFIALEQTNSINTRVELLISFFNRASDADKIWTIALFSGRKPKRTIKTALLREWAAEISQIPAWLFEESYHIVGDLAETIALLLPPSSGQSTNELADWIQIIKSLDGLTESVKKEVVTKAWTHLNREERFIFNKLITGGWRIGVSQKLVVRALAAFTGQEEKILFHRLMGNWTPENTTFQSLILTKDPYEDLSRPYPFLLAHPIEENPQSLGAPENWLLERKWDGIRGQIILRKGQLFVWSRGEELVTDKYPEFEILTDFFPNDIVFDGEILPYKNGTPLPFQQLQTRIGRKNITKSIKEKTPVSFFAYDLLELEGQDMRSQPLHLRRLLLEKQFQLLPSEQQTFLISPSIPFDDWSIAEKVRKESRQHNCEGLMIKHKDSTYESGRKRGLWWKWKIDPMVIDAVLIYAQRGHGRRANLFTDYTFAVWQENELVPFTKAYSGLTDKEFAQITQFVNKNTLERFGPVRRVKPELVFEIAFEGINSSSRHKSGVALRFPRMKRWRQDKPATEANTMDDLKAMLQQYHS